MMNGFDISHYQKGINLENMVFDFCIVKATQGVTYKDECFKDFADRVLKMNKLLGIYHYFGGNDPIKEAEFFVNTVKPYVGKAILVLDWEGQSNKLFSKGPVVAKPFLDKVYELTGVRPLIYMSKSVCRAHDWSSVVNANYGLWMAQYADYNPTGYKSQPWTDAKGTGAFKSYAIFQYTSSGQLDGFGGRLDLDVAYMTKDAWNKYAGKTETKVEQPKRPALKFGSKGQDVVDLQTILNRKGFNCGKADGIFGRKTERAVIYFQGMNVDENGKPLVKDGIVGKKTWAKLL